MSLGENSWMLVDSASQKEDSIVRPTNNFNKFMARVCPQMDKIPGRLAGSPHDLISSSWMPNRLISRIDAQSADIINLHWVNDGFLRIESLPKIKRPIVWTLHDMWAFCGGEYYVGGSTRYKEGYRADNRATIESGLDVNKWIWKRKKKSWSKIDNMVIVAPSRWLARCARESDLFGNRRVEVLPNGVDHNRFHPMNKAMVRDILGLPRDAKLVLFGSVLSTSDKRKGFHLLKDAFKKLQSVVNQDDYQMVVFGAPSGNSFGMKVHFIGRLMDEISIALVYAAADVFVAPSTEENLANTVLESLACGTPVVAFDIGGMPDMIKHKSNGYLAPGFDTDALARGIQWVTEDEHRWKKLSSQARETIIQSFTLQRSASRYIELYKDIL